MQKRFAESLKFPISEVNRRSSSEKGAGRPPFWEMFFTGQESLLLVQEELLQLLSFLKMLR
ncbi:hypothetical protein JCM12298_27770 [Desulfothermus naphthae]